ncbi:ShlB/FhaC/HecB family hemolysin secretion/activation protein [Xylophilus sp. Kf1]|nr:ShlB/FhaC/HecB family hemolysin secretion/activation protein [Xylophilus sp. Kf1]
MRKSILFPIRSIIRTTGAFATAGGMAFLAPSAAAQTAPLDAQQLQLQQQRETELRRALEPRPEGPPPEPAAPPPSRLTADDPGCRPVRSLRLQGRFAEEFGWLVPAANGPAAADPPVGRCLGPAGLAQLRSRLLGALVARGYVTSRVDVGAPAPGDDSGELVLTLLPGLVHAVRLDAGSAAARRSVAASVPATPGRPLYLRDLEQGLENLQRIPFVEADIVMEPADAGPSDVGLSDLVVRYRQGRPLRFHLSVDDGGSRATGRRQGTATVSWDNPLGLDDMLYLSAGRGLEQPSRHGTRSATLNYALPWGYWLFGATASRNRYYQSVAGASQDYVFRGASSQAELRVQRTVWRNGSARTSVGAKTFRRASSSFIDDTEIEVQRRVTGGVELNLAHHHFIGDAVLDASLAYRRGTGAYGALPAPEEAFGEGSSRMRLAVADLALLQPLTVAGQRLRLSGAWHAQWNGTPLTPQDRIAIGSRYTVRGFDGEALLMGERGWFVRNELAGAVGAGHEAYVGLDAGRVGGASTAMLAGRGLVGGVLGLRGQWRALSYDLFVGRPLHRPDTLRTAGTNLGFVLSCSF